jgi:transcriptional regulator GlxA family with amidase domain
MDSSCCPLFIKPEVWKSALYFQATQKAIKYLEEHVAERIDLQTIAAAACMEKTAFSKSFRRKTGLTFREFVQRYRISLAATQMGNSDESLTTIATGVGFNCLATFGRVFRKVAGDRPSHYRSAALRRTTGVSRAMPSFVEKKPTAAKNMPIIA